MSKETLKDQINADITTNGLQQITGAKLNNVLNDIVDEMALGGGVIEEGNTQAVSGGEVYDKIQINNDKLLNISANYTKLIKQGASHKIYSINTSEGVYLFVFNVSSLQVYLNDNLFLNYQAEERNALAVTGYDNGSELVIILSYALNYIKIARVNKTTKSVNVSDTVFTDYNSVTSIVDISGTLYACAERGNSNTTYAVDLFKLLDKNTNNWVLQSNIANINDIWGGDWINEHGVRASTLTQKVSPTFAKISYNQFYNEIYCSYVQANGISVEYQMIFTKVSKDNGLTWDNKKIQPNYRSSIPTTFSDKYGETYLTGRIYSDGLYVESVLNIIKFSQGNYYFQTNITNVSNITCAYNPISDVLLVYACGMFDGTYNLYTQSIDMSQVRSSVNCAPKTFKGYLKDFNNVSSFSEFKNGDYIVTNEAISSNLFLESTNPYRNSIGLDYLKNPLNNTINIVKMGNRWGKNIISNTPKERIDTFVFEHNANRNDFISRAFRIPCVVEAKNKWLIAGADIRYTTGLDYDEISIGIRISKDNGLNWGNSKVIFEREQGDGKRVHDMSMVVDKLSGRIYAFAKYFNYNASFGNQTYYGDSTYVDFKMCYSDDNGLNWTTPSSLKNLFPENCISISVGCSAGIQLKNGTLVMPVYLLTQPWNNNSGFIYKELGSDIWKLSKMTTNNNNNECTIIQDKDDSLIMNCRTYTGIRAVYRMVGVNGDWVNMPQYETLMDSMSGCAASMVRYRDVYLFSKQTDLTQSPTNFVRKNITVFISKDLIKWEELILISDKDVQTDGYSSLVVTDSNFGILFENNINLRDLKYTNLEFLRNVLN